MENEEMIIDSQTGELIKSSELELSKWDNFKIVTGQDYLNSTDVLKQVKSRTKQLEDAQSILTKPLNDRKKSIMDIFRKPIELGKSIEQKIKSGIITYQNEQEAIRQEAERKAQEAARKQELAEKAKLQARIDKAVASGKNDKAEALAAKQDQVFVPAPIIPSSIPKVAGVTTKKLWRYKVIDSNVVPRQYLIVNDEMLKKFAVATKGSVKIDGIEFYEETVLSSSRG